LGGPKGRRGKNGAIYAVAAGPRVGTGEAGVGRWPAAFRFSGWQEMENGWLAFPTGNNNNGRYSGLFRSLARNIFGFQILKSQLRGVLGFRVASVPSVPFVPLQMPSQVIMVGTAFCAHCFLCTMSIEGVGVPRTRGRERREKGNFSGLKHFRVILLGGIGRRARYGGRQKNCHFRKKKSDAMCGICVRRCVMLRCGQSLRAISAVVVAGALCVERGVRVSGVSQCLHVGQFCERHYISVQFCFLFFLPFCFVLCCACVRHSVLAVLCVCALTCGRSLRAISLCGKLWWQVRCASEVECVECRTACTSGSSVLPFPCRSVLRCVMLRSGQSLRVLHCAVCAVFFCVLQCGVRLWSLCSCDVLYHSSVLCCAVVGAGCRFGALRCRFGALY
jgi:hypothetical protein